MKKSMSEAMSYYSSSAIISQSWFFILLLFIFATFLSCPSTTTNELSYSDHCNSVVPKSNPTTQEVITFSFPRYPTTYFSGGSPFLSQNSSTISTKYLLFRTRKVYKTNVDGVLKVEASLMLINPPDGYYYGYGKSQSIWAGSRRPRFGVLRFGLNGFWSEASGKVCMVGLGTTSSKHGDLLNLGAVLKLNYVKNSSIVTSLGSGTLESLSSVHDSNYFTPISILMFTEMNNEYGLVMREFEDEGFNGSDVPQSLPISCSLFSSFNLFELTYPSTCSSAKNCTPFGGSIGYLPHGMTLNLMECSEESQRLRVLVKFFKTTTSYYDGGYYSSFEPNTTLIGEGLWDEKKNQLWIVACKILNATGSLENARVGDCSIRLSLRIPATWSISDSSTMLGQIWSSKPANDSEYFDKIVYRSTQNRADGVGGLTYEYTQIDRVRKFCTPAKTDKDKKKKERYPDGDSYDMSFSMYVSSSKGSFAWGHSNPLFVGDHFYEQNGYVMTTSSSMPMVSEMGKNSSLEVPVNISYKISFTEEIRSAGFGGGNSTYNLSLTTQGIYVEINAEGVYDAETGGLCMVGCKRTGKKGQLSMMDAPDCEILVRFQFPSLNSRNNNGGGYIKGSIESTRKKSDPLYFEHLDLTSSVYVTYVANDNILRMDCEIILVLISNTLACVFVALQLFHVKKHSETPPFASLVMLAILTFSYMIPLLLNFEALFLHNRDGQNVLLESGKWIEVNEVLVRVITMVAFLLQFRLLQLTWSSRLGDHGGSQKRDLWALEKKAFLHVLLPLYVSGALITGLVNWQKNNSNLNIVLSPFSSQSESYQKLLGGMKSYAGLVLDGFLLPQIFLNMFGNTREKALCFPYYIGTTFIRLLPHAYDLYRAHINDNAGHFERSYIYANHGADFYSAAWDVTIPCVALVFAAIIFLQQRFGGRCILPRRFRAVEEYEKVPVISNE